MNDVWVFAFAGLIFLMFVALIIITSLQLSKISQMSDDLTKTCSTIDEILQRIFPPQTQSLGK